MPGIEIKGRSKIANYRHGGRTGKFGGGRTNLLEQLGRVEAEPSNRNRRAEISRVHGELNRGYKDGGRIGFRTGKGVVPRRSQPPHKETTIPSRLDSQRKNIRLRSERKRGKYRDPNTAKPEWSLNKWGLKEGGRIGLKHGKQVKRNGPVRPINIPWSKPGEIPTKKAKGGRIGLKKGGKPWGTGPKPGTHEFLMQQLHKPRKGKAIGGPAARVIKQALKPKGEFKKDKSWYESRQKPPQLRKSKKERREEYRKKIQKGGGNVVFADEWKHIDPGLQKGLFKKDGGRAGLKKGGKSDKKWIQKAVDPKHKGYCTPMTKKTCTPARKALARTFKKKAKTGW